MGAPKPMSCSRSMISTGVGDVQVPVQTGVQSIMARQRRILWPGTGASII